MHSAASSSYHHYPTSSERRYSDPSDEEALNEAQAEAASRKRSSRACDQCRKTKSKCERGLDDNAPCKSCAVAGLECTFLGPSYKRGPPKGYIHAIEQRWHHVESILGAILASPDPRAQGLISDLRRDDLAREILNRVDAGPFGPSGRLHHPASSTKEDMFASILHSHQASQNREGGRSRRQSRVSREIVSSNSDINALPTPTNEWQDRLAARLATSSSFSRNSYGYSNGISSNEVMYDQNGAPLPQRRRLDLGSTQPDWSNLYTMDDNSDIDNDIEDGEGADAIGHLSLDENSELRYHGTSSGLHLLNRTDRKDARNEGGIWRMPMAGVWPHSTIRPARLPTEEELNVTMPPVETRDILIEAYFTHCHPCFPIVNKRQFMAEYNEKYHGSPPADRASRADTPASAQASRLLLLAMFALASRYVGQPSTMPNNEMWEAGCNYAMDAREVLNKIYHHSRPSTCQALLLMGLYECGIGSMENSWLYIGMACRMAEDLGMNRNADKWSYNGARLFNAVEKQIRKQIWWGCCLLDKYISVYMGRPIMINRTDFDTPLPEVTQADEDETWQPLPQDPQYNPNYPPLPERTMSCFRASCMLAVIIGDIMKKIYPVRMTTFTRRVELPKLETKLDHWYIDLPEPLRFDTTSKRTAPPPNILLLHVRYWSAVLLLHRAFIPKRKGTQLESDTVLLKSFDLCQTAASHMSAIATIWNTEIGLKCGTPFLPPYILSAGIMHVVTLTLRPGNVQASLGLRQSLAALKEMEILWPSAGRAWELLDGARVQFEGVITPLVDSSERASTKRGAEDAFGRETSSEMLQREAFGALQKHPSPPPTAAGSQDVGTRIMAHMLGLDIPGIEPSTSYFPGYEWWPQTRGAGHPNMSQETRSPATPNQYGMQGNSGPLPPVQDWMPGPGIMNGYSFDPTQGQHPQHM